MSGKRASLSMTDIAELRALVSIALWIRSEQMIQRDVQRLVKTVDPATWDKVSVPMTFIDTRDLMLSNAIAEQAAARDWWNKLDTILESFDERALQPKWRR